jgi:hypothetical protein
MIERAVAYRHNFGNVIRMTLESSFFAGWRKAMARPDELDGARRATAEMSGGGVAGAWRPGQWI